MGGLKWCDRCGGSIAAQEAQRARLVHGELLCPECAGSQDDGLITVDDEDFITAEVNNLESTATDEDEGNLTRPRAAEGSARPRASGHGQAPHRRMATQRSTSGGSSDKKVAAQGCAGCLVVVILIALVGTCFQKDSGDKSSVIFIGDSFALKSDVVVAASEAAFDEMLTIVLAKDRIGFADLLANGQIVNLTGGTQVRLLEVGGLTRPCRIRVESGDFVGEDAWVAYEVLQGK